MHRDGWPIRLCKLHSIRRSKSGRRHNIVGHNRLPQKDANVAPVSKKTPRQVVRTSSVWVSAARCGDPPCVCGCRIICMPLANSLDALFIPRRMSPFCHIAEHFGCLEKGGSRNRQADLPANGRVFEPAFDVARVSGYSQKCQFLEALCSLLVSSLRRSEPASATA
jgi:hypothetical protein